jgi:hypothetical protein
MSRGISERQRLILQQLLQLEKKGRKVIAWRQLRDHEKTDWNTEQSLRRALRSLEKRGLVELGTYSFMPRQERQRLRGRHYRPALDAVGEWIAQDAWHHTSRSHYMTGVSLTDKGRQVATELP